MDTAQGFPQIAAAFTDPTTGRIQQAWLQLLIALWNRTGQGQGTDTAVIVTDLTVIAALVDQLTVLSLAAASPAGLSKLADAVEGLEVLGLQRPFIAPPSVEPSDLDIIGLARGIFAASLMVARAISITGDATWTVDFDGSADVTAALTLATVNADVGTWGDATHVPQFTVNAKGLITAVTSVAISGGSGGAYVPITDGAEPPTLISDGAGQLIFVPYSPP